MNGGTKQAVVIVVIAGSLIGVGECSAQSLLDRRPMTTRTVSTDGGTMTTVLEEESRELMDISLFAVEPPKPREFQQHDLITVIISERSSMTQEGTLETTKEANLDGNIASIPNLLKLLELRYEDYQGLPIQPSLDYSAEFTGEGDYEQDKEVTARVTARVVEVKPNGTLLIESKTQVTTDEEEQVIVISGVCRPDDVTSSNTVQSNQLFGLRVDIQHSGQVANAAKKGLIPRIFDTLFNF